MRSLFARLLGCLALVASAGAAEAPREKHLLLAAEALPGWQCVNPEHTPFAQVATLRPDGVLAISGKPTGYLATTAAYENYLLHAEWRWPAQPGNSGVLLHISPGPLDRVWPVCFQVQMRHQHAGDLLPMSTAGFATPLTTAPGAKTPQLDRTGPEAEKPAGQWNTCDVLCRGDAIEVLVNGLHQNLATGCRPAAGQVGFQLEGVPFELRNVWIAPLPRAIGSSWQPPSDRLERLPENR